MNRFVELTASLATFIEQKQRAGFNLIVLLALIAVIVHFLSPKDQLEKNEALKQVLLFGGILFILHFMLTVVTSLGQVANSDPFYLANVFGLSIGGYWLSYTLQVKAKKDGKPVLHTKAYRELEDIEVWLDAKGQQGFLLDSASPDYFGFNFIQTDCPYQYKTAYYPSSKMKEMAAFVEKNERDGWEFVRTGLSNGYVNPKKTIGLNTVAI